MQRQYGKSPQDLKMMVEGFSEILAGYSLEIIDRAFFEYLKRNKEIPTPSEILSIIHELDRKSRVKIL